MQGGHVLIAGGGIGGLTAAVALLKHGFEVEVFEAAHAFADIGAGVTLAPNAMIAMNYLGIDAPIIAQSVEPTRQQVRHWQNGRVLMTLDRGHRMRDLYDAPYLYCHRADLHAILIAAVADLGGKLHLDAAVASVSANADAATVTLRGGSVFEGDLVVGADGLKSVVRQLYDPAPAHFTGHVAWRALVQVGSALSEFAENPGTFIGPNRLVVVYPLRGSTLLNLVFFARQPGWSDDGWTIPARRAELEAIFAGWAAPVQLMIANTEDDRLFKWAINARTQLPSWSIDDRITLLGDSAHAMTPFLGQGASSAIEDAVVLARALAAAPTQAQGLVRYEAARIERTSLIQAESNANANRLQGSDAELFGMSKLRNEESLGLFAYNAGTVQV
jgi:salicylate hydroxylase